MTDTRQPNTARPLTIVTAFFAIEDRHRNRSARDYYAWMARFLPFIRWPMVVYCDARSVDAIKRVRGNKPTLYRVTDLQAFSVHRYRDAIIAQAKQKNRHFPADLFMVWHEKANFMRRVIDENPYHSEMFFWCDAGFFRPHKTHAWFRLSERIEWPNRRICQAAFANRMAFFRRSIRAPSPGELPAQIVAGFWGGPGDLARQFCDDYYRFLNQCIDRETPSSDERYDTDEVMITAMANNGEFNMRPLTVQDVPYLDKLHPSRNLTTYLPIFYCLSGGRFPWACIGREVSLFGYLRYAAKRIYRRVSHGR